MSSSLILSCMSPSYILDTNPLLFISLENIFPHSVGFLFMLSMVSFAVQKLWSLIQSHLFIFVFISFAWEDTAKKIYFHSTSQRMFLPMFSLRSFTVSGLIFRSFNLLWVHFCIWYEEMFQYYCFTWSCPVFPAPLTEGAVFPHCPFSPPLPQANWP